MKTIRALILFVSLLITAAPPALGQVPAARLRSGQAQTGNPSPNVFYTVPADSYLVITDVQWEFASPSLVIMPPSGTTFTFVWSSPTLLNASQPTAVYIPESHLVSGL